ncbi:hypothetical protein NKR19_g3442 [Coniochaeta hoffmannii]|uniref:Uncharacterized protein n=1 Tax=Coniochaeta hoffmannii TaxID=91930 RepID=A0AA38VY78_9PEZI|nr:hypothetical protein NKR19_g3442 [Coniochaeta hoffmannii]
MTTRHTTNGPQIPPQPSGQDLEVRRQVVLLQVRNPVLSDIQIGHSVVALTVAERDSLLDSDQPESPASSLPLSILSTWQLRQTGGDPGAPGFPG